MNKNITITEELIDKFIDGNTSLEETAAAIKAAEQDDHLHEMLDSLMHMKKKFGDTDREESTAIHLPVSAVDIAKAKTVPMPKPQLWQIREEAAKGSLKDDKYSDENDCVVKCEHYILSRHGYVVSLDELKKISLHHHWLQEGGTRIYNIGRLTELFDLVVARKVEATPEDLLSELRAGCEVILVVNAAKLYGEPTESNRPNHAIAVRLNSRNELVIYDPMVMEDATGCTLETLQEAWQDSNDYMVSVAEEREYNPQPIDISDIKDIPEYVDMMDFIAELFHDQWARERIKQGWTYGETRDDNNKKHPDLVPYSKLDDDEKKYDRINALLAYKALLKLGYKITRE